jgi:hypothetical protein
MPASVADRERCELVQHAETSVAGFKGLRTRNYGIDILNYVSYQRNVFATRIPLGLFRQRIGQTGLLLVSTHGWGRSPSQSRSL